MRRHICPDVVHDQKLVCLSPRASARSAARLMTDLHVSSVLVMEHEKLAGIVTVRDIARRVVGAGLDPDRTHLSSIMTRDPICVDGEETPMRALRMMKDGGFRHLPVRRGEQIIGILVRSDFNTEEAQCMEFEQSLWEHMR